MPAEDRHREGRRAQLLDVRRKGGHGEDHHAVRAHRPNAWRKGMRDFRKPIPQGPGWACFYCDEVFLTQGEAEDHFGFFGETVDNSDPGCVQALTYGEKALRAALMEMYRELDAEREESHELQNVVESLQGIRPDLERLFDGASTPHQAWLKMDSVEGRALAAEAIISAIEQKAPDLVAAAREEVCRPPALEPSS